MDRPIGIDYRLFQVGRQWVYKYLAIRSRSHQILEDNAFGQSHKELGNILHKAYHLCPLVHKYPRTCLRAGNRLNQHLRYKASAWHYKALGTLTGILCHRFP